MSAYQTAVDVVKSKYFAIFDSHCEVAEGRYTWLIFYVIKLIFISVINNYDIYVFISKKDCECKWT